MFDLRRIVEEFIDENLDSFKKDELYDVPTLAAIQNKLLAISERQSQVVKWLNAYKVVRYFPRDTTASIAREILEFADEHSEWQITSSATEIISKFRTLGGRVQNVLPKNKSGQPRDVTSLTSKALWCCFPEIVPIFDDYAFRALQMLSRLCKAAATQGESDYERFISVWFMLYKQVDDLFDRVDTSIFPYKVRGFDRFLWYLGQKNFYQG